MVIFGSAVSGRCAHLHGLATSNRETSGLDGLANFIREWEDWRGVFIKDQEGTEPDSAGGCLKKTKSLDFHELGIFLAIVISAFIC